MQPLIFLHLMSMILNISCECTPGATVLVFLLEVLDKSALTVNGVHRNREYRGGLEGVVVYYSPPDLSSVHLFQHLLNLLLPFEALESD